MIAQSLFASGVLEGPRCADLLGLRLSLLVRRLVVVCCWIVGRVCDRFACALTFERLRPMLPRHLVPLVSLFLLYSLFVLSHATRTP